MKLADLQEVIKEIGPVGSMVLKPTGSLFQQPGAEVEIFGVAKGVSALRMTRDANMGVIFTHSNPGVGTRACRAQLPDQEPTNNTWIFMNWKPEKASFVIAWRDSEEKEVLNIVGEPCDPPYRLQVAVDGQLVIIGSDVGEIQETHIWFGDRPYLQPSAIEYWSRTLEVCDALTSGVEGESIRKIQAVSNAAVSALITGFEVYVRMRLVEIERESQAPDIERFFRKELSAAEQSGLPEALAIQAAAEGETVLQHYIRVRKMSAQSYDRAKDLFNWLYGLSVANLDIAPAHISQARIAVAHRHYQTHTDPAAFAVFERGTATMIDVPNVEFAAKCREALNQIVITVHQATLTLRPRNGSRS